MTKDKGRKKTGDSPRVCSQYRSVFSTIIKKKAHQAEDRERYLILCSCYKIFLSFTIKTKSPMYSQNNGSTQNKVWLILTSNTDTLLLCSVWTGKPRLHQEQKQRTAQDRTNMSYKYVTKCFQQHLILPLFLLPEYGHTFCAQDII